MSLPLFIVCQNKACQKLVSVRGRWEQRRKKFCSRHCAGTVSPVTRLPRSVLVAAALKANEGRRQKAVAKFATLSKSEVARHAYRLGWKKGLRKGFVEGYEKGYQKGYRGL